MHANITSVKRDDNGTMKWKWKTWGERGVLPSNPSGLEALGGHLPDGTWQKSCGARGK